MVLLNKADKRHFHDNPLSDAARFLSSELHLDCLCSLDRIRAQAHFLLGRTAFLGDDCHACTISYMKDTRKSRFLSLHNANDTQYGEPTGGPEITCRPAYLQAS